PGEPFRVTCHASAGVHHRTRTGLMAVICLAELLLVLDATVVIVAVVNVGRDLHLGAQALSWVINGYALTFGGFLLVGGRAADLYGRRRVVLGAVSAFGATSLACGLATGPASIILARLGQGAS